MMLDNLFFKVMLENSKTWSSKICWKLEIVHHKNVCSKLCEMMLESLGHIMFESCFVKKMLENLVCKWCSKFALPRNEYSKKNLHLYARKFLCLSKQNFSTRFVIRNFFFFFQNRFFQAQYKISQTRPNENQKKTKKLVAYERKTTKTNE